MLLFLIPYSGTYFEHKLSLLVIRKRIAWSNKMRNLFLIAYHKHLRDVLYSYKLLTIIAENYVIVPTFIVDLYTPCLAHVLYTQEVKNTQKVNKSGEIIPENGMLSTESTFNGSKVLETTLLLYNQINSYIHNDTVNMYAGGAITHMPIDYTEASTVRHVGLPLCSEILYIEQIKHSFMTNAMGFSCGAADSCDPIDTNNKYNKENTTNSSKNKIGLGRHSHKSGKKHKHVSQKDTTAELKEWMQSVDENCSFLTHHYYANTVQYR